MGKDEILELQTSIQSLPSQVAEEQTYLVGIESVRDGRWTTHCEGTAVVSAHMNYNGWTPQTNGSNFHKHTKDYLHSTTTLDRITREDSDPYQLHPLTIYGCLQHALASAAMEEHAGNGGSGDIRPASADGLKITDVEEFRVWSSGERMGVGGWTAQAVNRGVRLEDQVASVDIELKDETGAVASILRGLQVTRCKGEMHEAFDKDLPPPEPKARVPAFLRPLLG